MSRVFSFRDLKRIPALSKFSETDLLSIEMDDLVNRHLAELGFNIKAPILYVPSKHRDLSGAVAVGFMAVGTISTNRAFLNSSLCTPVERLIAASFHDMSLTKELSRLLGHSVDFGPAENDEACDDWPEELTEPDYMEVSAEILSLENLRDSIRGTPYNEQGALKTPHEYKYFSDATVA